MKLYHGSPVPNLTVLRPPLSKHSRPLVYLTDIPELAAIYAHNPLTPPNYFFSYYVRDGVLHYDEYFPGQLDCEREGRLTIHRYAAQSEKYLATIHRLIAQEIAERRLRDDPDDDYAVFLRAHFPDLF